jgi:hypothetical protein
LLEKWGHDAKQRNKAGETLFEAVATQYCYVKDDNKKHLDQMLFLIAQNGGVSFRDGERPSKNLPKKVKALYLEWLVCVTFLVKLPFGEGLVKELTTYISGRKFIKYGRAVGGDFVPRVSRKNKRKLKREERERLLAASNY